MIALEITYSASSSRFICKKEGKTIRRISRDFALNLDEQILEIAKELMPNWERVAIGSTAKGWVVVPVI